MRSAGAAWSLAMATAVISDNTIDFNGLSILVNPRRRPTPLPNQARHWAVTIWR